MSDKPAGLLSAILAVQGEATTLPKDATNPHYHSKFTPLDTIVEKVGPILNRHGLVWMTKPGSDEHGQPALHYTLAHAASGEREEGTMLLLLTKSDPQGQGSAITYARRYSLCAVLNLVADDDDDGQVASSGRSGANEKPTAPQLKFLKTLVTQNKPPERTMRAMLDQVGAQEVDFAAGWTDKISKQQASELIEIFKTGSLPDPQAVDVPIPLEESPSSNSEHGDDLPWEPAA